MKTTGMLRKIKSLEKRIRKAQQAYYNEEPIMDDEQFDKLIDQLAVLDPDSPLLKAVGFAPDEDSRLKKVKHTIPMGSLRKVNSEEEFRAWAKKVGVEEVVLQEKLDGISVELTYEKGKLTQAASRGDGFTGEDITHNVRHMGNVDEALPKKFTGHLRGEIFMKKSVFAKHYSDKKNPRNAASGIARRKKTEGAKHLSVKYFDCISNDTRFETITDKYEFIEEQLDLEVALWDLVDLHDAVKLHQRHQDHLREKLDYEIDALVAKVNSLELQRKLGVVNNRPNGMVAFKFVAAMRETKINEISWEIGLTGRITPVAHVEPVEIGGVTISNVSLHNVKNMQNLEAGPGATVLISRRNDVIPYIEKVVKKSGVEFVPEECPACDEGLEWEGEFLVCVNDDCPAKLFGDLQKWVAVTEIDEVGPEFLKTVIEEGFISDVSNLYTITIKDLLGLPGFKQKKASKIIGNIDKSRRLSLATFLSALNIAGIGKSTFEAMIDAGYSDLDKLFSANKSDLTKIKDVGDITAKIIVSGLKKRKKLIKAILGKGVTIMNEEKKDGKLVGKSFCFTGALDIKRAEAQKMVKDLGGECKSSVSKGLTYLVQSDPDSESTKSRKAKQLGTQVIGEEEFLKMAGG